MCGVCWSGYRCTSCWRRRIRKGEADVVGMKIGSSLFSRGETRCVLAPQSLEWNSSSATQVAMEPRLRRQTACGCSGDVWCWGQVVVFAIWNECGWWMVVAASAFMHCEWFAVHCPRQPLRTLGASRSHWPREPPSPKPDDSWRRPMSLVPVSADGWVLLASPEAPLCSQRSIFEGCHPRDSKGYLR